MAASSRLAIIRAVITLALLASIGACGSEAAPLSTASPAIVAGSPGPVADVATWKGGNTRTAVMPGPGPASRPEPFWTRDLSNLAEGQPLVIDGTVIVATTGGELVGIEADTGRLAWDGWVLPAGVRSQPAADAGTLYLVTDDGVLRALSLADRRERWHAPNFSPNAMVAVADGLVIAGAPGELAAVLVDGGAQAWRVPAPASKRVAVGGGRAYATGDGSDIVTVVDVATHAVTSEQALGADLLTAGLDPDGVVVGHRDVAGGENGVVAFGRDGTQRWSMPSTDRGRVEIVALANNLALVITESPSIADAFDRATGRLLWSRPYDGDHVGGGVVAGDVLYTIDSIAGLVAVDVATQSERWRTPFGGALRPTALVVTGGLIIASTPAENGTGQVVAFAERWDPRQMALRAHPEATTAPVPSSTEAPPIFEVVGVQELEGDVFPMDPALGPDGAMYMVDRNSNRILIRAQDGTLTWWGEPGTGDGQFNFNGTTQNDAAGGVAVSPDGSLIAVGDGGNSRVQLFDGQRQFTKHIGRRGRGDGQFVNPCCVTIDSRNRIWVVDTARMDVQVFDETGAFLDQFAEPGRGDGQLARPGAAFIREDTGEVYIADFDNHRVAVFDEQGTPLRSYGSRPEQTLVLNGVNHVEVDAAGRMYVVDTSNRIFVLDPDGNRIATIGSVLPDGLGPIEPGFTLDGQGRMYLADLRVPHRIIVLQLLPPLWPPAG